MTSFVLVHGAWHGAWCWYRVVPLLERLGHRVATPELPGHGRDRAPVPTLSLQAYADRVGEALDAVDEPVTLVGHSLGGMVITQAAEDRPDRVRKLVYLAAFLPGNGQSLADLLSGEEESLLTPASVVDRSLAIVSLRPEGLRPGLYADCRDEDVALAERLLLPEALAPLVEKARLTPERSGRIPRVYIECLEDRALPVARQRLMQAAQPCGETLGLRSGHSPFFSMSETLVACLAGL